MRYTVGKVSEMTGLSAHTIRAWERRYSVLEPDRTGSNRRLYNDEDVARLRAIKKLVDAGHRIGQVAQIGAEEWSSLHHALSEEHSDSTSSGTEGTEMLRRAREAIMHLDGEALDKAMQRALAAMGVMAYLEEIVLPLLTHIEIEWTTGKMSISQEHLATAILRGNLDRIRTSLSGSSNGPGLLVTTPSGQHHELGALIVAIVGALQSWSVTYLGPNLPAEEIAASARQCRVCAIGLSLVFPAEDPIVAKELVRLRELVGESTIIYAGGRAASSYRPVLDQIGAKIPEDLSSFADSLIMSAGLGSESVHTAQTSAVLDR